MNKLLLRTHLAAAVPLRIHELQRLPDADLDRIRVSVADRLQEGGDTMQFGGGEPGQAATAIGAWTTAFAILALTAQGGVDFQGLHWCRIPYCRASSRYDHAADPWVATAPASRTRPIHDLPDLGTWPPPPAA